jgi:hypothetical protein
MLFRNGRDILLEILKTLKRQNELHSGRTWGTQLVLTVGQPAIELYFLATYIGDIKLPTGQRTFMPRHPFRRIYLTNEGNADIYYDCNYKPGDWNLNSLLRANEDVQLEATGQEPFFSFSARAIPPGGPDPLQNVTNWNGDGTTAHLRLVCLT